MSEDQLLSLMAAIIYAATFDPENGWIESESKCVEVAASLRNLAQQKRRTPETAG